MDIVDVALHVEPLTEAVKELKDQLNVFAMSINAKLDAIAETLTRQADIFNQKLDQLMERTKPKSSCLFCSIDDNKDNHPTGRCCRFPDPVSRAAQAANLQLCNRCLQPRHPGDCGVQCTYCGRDHNALLCPSRSSQSSSPFKRRKI
uniref:Uncharacterized protein n=1 Tax=Haemonchus contortus TaxID=6289 RepID=A0A7I4XXP8_HAECO